VNIRQRKLKDKSLYVAFHQRDFMFINIIVKTILPSTTTTVDVAENVHTY